MIIDFTIDAVTTLIHMADSDGLPAGLHKADILDMLGEEEVAALFITEGRETTSAKLRIFLKDDVPSEGP